MAGLVVTLHPHVGGRVIGVAVQQMDVAQDVPEFVQPGRVRRHGLLHVVHDPQGFEVEPRWPGPRPGPPAATRPRPRRSARPRSARRPRPGRAGRRSSGRSGSCPGDRRPAVTVTTPGVASARGDVDAADPGVGQGRAQGRPVEHPVAVQVAGVRRTPPSTLGTPSVRGALSPTRPRAPTSVDVVLLIVPPRYASDRTYVGKRESRDVH